MPSYEETHLEIKYVTDEGGIASGEGFVGEDGRRLVRVPGATIQIVVRSPRVIKSVEYVAKRDARRTETTPSFRGQQHSGDLESQIRTIISGKGVVSGLGARRRTTLSILGDDTGLTEMKVRLENAAQENGTEVTGFGIDWFAADYIEPNGGFHLNGILASNDIELLQQELRDSKNALTIELAIGQFPGFFGEWSFEGWDGGDLKFCDREICRRVVRNHEEMPADFFNPETPFDSKVHTNGPSDLVRFLVVSERAPQDPE